MAFVTDVFILEPTVYCPLFKEDNTGKSLVPGIMYYTEAEKPLRPVWL